MGSVVPKGAYIDEFIRDGFWVFHSVLYSRVKKISAVYIFFFFMVLAEGPFVSRERKTQTELLKTHLDNSASLLATWMVTYSICWAF